MHKRHENEQLDGASQRGDNPESPEAESARPYFRLPSLSPDGKTLVFIYASDIWHGEVRGGIAERLPIHNISYHPARFSPDGSLLAFASNRTGNGDVYVFPLNGGEMRQLTYHQHFCQVDDWSPDGKHIYYTTVQEHVGHEEIYRVALEGGTPVPLFIEPHETLEHVSVSPDGSMVAYNIPHNPWWRLGPDPFAPCPIWIMPNTPHPPTPAGDSELSAEQKSIPSFLPGLLPPPTLFGQGRWPLWSPDGEGLYFVSDRSGSENIWYQSRLGGEAQQITYFTQGRVTWPAIAREANIMVFERDWEIWSLDLRSGEAAPIPIEVHADTKMVPIRYETWTRGFSEVVASPDGKKLAFVSRGQIFADFADKETDKEIRQGPAFRVTNGAARHGSVVWTTDSKSLIYKSDRYGEDELFRYDFSSRMETRLTHDLCPKSSPCCSPDGTWVAYIRAYESVFLLNLKTNESREFVKGNFILTSGLAWSPDSQWLAFISHDERFFSNVSVQHLEETTPHQITFLSNLMGSDLMWSPNGRFLIFNSTQYRTETQIVRVDLRHPTPFFREEEFEKLFLNEPKPEEPKKGEEEKPSEEPESPSPTTDADHSTANPEGVLEDEPEQSPEKTPTNPKPEGKSDKTPSPEKVEIVFDGIERRLSFLTPIQMGAEAQAISYNSRDLLFLATVAGKVNVWTLPMDDPRRDHPPQQITATNTSKRNVRFFPNDKMFFYLEDGQIVVRKFPSGNEPVTIAVRAEVTVDFEQEKLQVFGEAWRLLRDTFYDSTFRGRDWEAIRKAYTPLVRGVRTRSELQTILNLMVGELRASHLGAHWNWHSGSGNDGYTGLLFDPFALAEHKVLRIAGIVPDSPAALLSDPPRIGEYLVAVNGTPITPQINLDYLLQRTVGRRVMIQLAPTPDSDQTRDIALRPVDSHCYKQLRYQAWVAMNEVFVHQVSQGRLGYVHVPEMSYDAYQEFLVNLDVETHSKEGVVLDIRFNRGGHIATFILDVLTRRSVLISGFRDRLTTDAYHYSGNRVLNKPTILVTNENSASNAEIFTEIYRRLGLGLVVGKPTSGAVIGTIQHTFLNWMAFRLPVYSIRTPEGENLEGTGRMVDVEVDQPPGAWINGHDYQLEAAVKVLLKKLDQEMPVS